jgi:hypothetical protein
MPLPQDIRPVFQDIQDTLVSSESPWIETTPMSKVRVLWIGRESGHWGLCHPLEEGLRRAAAQAPRWRACLRPLR